MGLRCVLDKDLMQMWRPGLVAHVTCSACRCLAKPRHSQNPPEDGSNPHRTEFTAIQAPSSLLRIAKAQAEGLILCVRRASVKHLRPLQRRQDSLPGRQDSSLPWWLRTSVLGGLLQSATAPRTYARPGQGRRKMP